MSQDSTVWATHEALSPTGIPVTYSASGLSIEVVLLDDYKALLQCVVLLGL